MQHLYPKLKCLLFSIFSVRVSPILVAQAKIQALGREEKLEQLDSSRGLPRRPQKLLMVKRITFEV